MKQNRAQRLYDILKDGNTYDSCTLSAMLQTGCFRAVRELRKNLLGSGATLRTVRHDRHNEHSHAVYRLDRPLVQSALPMMQAIPVKESER